MKGLVLLCLFWIII